MTLGRPELLHLLWLVPVVALLLVASLRSRRDALARLGSLVPARTSAGAQRVHRARAALWVAALALLLMAQAQPRWGYRWQEIRREGLDVMVVLDASRSMDAQDVSPSRMEQARREVLDLADILAGDRVGMVIFAGGAHPDVPLTLDYDVLRTNVRRSETARLLAQGSDLAGGIELGVQLMGDQTESDRAMIILSDGEDHSERAREAAQAAADAGVRLYTMGIGTTDGAPIPLEGGGFQKDRSGEVVLSRLDESLLRDIARIGSGAYVRAGAGMRDVQAIYEGEIRARLTGAEQGVRRDKIWNEHYQWPLAGAFLLLVAGAFVRPGPLRLSGVGGASAALLIALAAGRPAAAQAPGDPVADLARQQAERPDDLDLAERLGGALYGSGDFNRAFEVLDGVAERAASPERAARARTNAGLAAYRAGRLTQAVDAWDRVLQSDPENESAAANKAAVEQEIARRLQQDPPEQQPQDGEQQPQDGEQQPQDGEQQPQDGEQQPQDGEQQPQDGEQQPQDGEQQPQDGEQQPQDGEQQPGEPPPPSDGTNNDGEPQDPDEAGDTGPTEPLFGDPTDPADGEASDGEPQPGDPGADGPTRPGAVDPGEAERLLDTVEEGTPRVRTQNRKAGEKDW